MRDCQAVWSAVLVSFCLGSVVQAATPRFRTVEIDGQIGVGYAVATGEMNGDGRPDILVVDRREIAWYENPYWNKHVILRDVGPNDNVCIAVDDIDGDGLSDIAIGAHWNPRDTVDSGSVYYLAPPQDRRQPWRAVELPREPTVHRMRWADADGDDRLELIMAPLHGRGNKNFAGEGVRVLLYEVPPAPARDPWPTRVVDDSLHVVHNLDVVRWDGDRAHEILLASFEGVFLCDRTSGGTWTRKQLGSGNQETSPYRGSSEIRAGRLPGGQRYLATIEPWHGHQVVVYTPPKGEQELWPRRVLAEDVKQGHAVQCADLLGEGSDQLLIGWREPAGPNEIVGVKLFVPRDDGGENWDVHPVDEGGMACEDLTVADLNGDGRLDIIAAGRATHNLRIYFNESSR